jgi:hypothetical protein
MSDTKGLKPMINTQSRLALSLLSMSAALSIACAPAKAPGSDPSDMTPEGHRAAAQEEQQKAAEHEQNKDAVPPSKPNAEFGAKAAQENQAEQHKDYAEQHEHAAEAAESGGTATPAKK